MSLFRVLCCVPLIDMPAFIHFSPGCVAVALQYNLTSAIEVSSALFLFLRTALPIHTYSFFCASGYILGSFSVSAMIVILMKIPVNLEIAFGNIAILNSISSFHPQTWEVFSFSLSGFLFICLFYVSSFIVL